MTSPKKSVIDPDYELTEMAREHVKLKESVESRETLEKIITVINREFKTELDHRQSQLDLIQQRLNKAQKTLHLLRYILINSYYNNQDMFVQQVVEQADELPAFNKNGLHPALKKLVLNDDYKLNFTKSPRKKMKYLDSHISLDTKEKPLPELDSEQNGKIPVIQTNKYEISHTIVNSNKNVQKEEYDTARNRKKEKYRIVVGNISKWMPSKSEEDKSTHKWMVYVRGSKESPDISHFVEKVVFYLHPSYEPNDIVELRHPPFHLSRRGWGEFPLRVKIFFQYALNKPVDIIHNLKLDKTFTGHQTLGNETIVNLFLYTNEKMGVQAKENEENSLLFIKEEIEDQDESSRTDLSVYTENVTNEISEHDYCTAGTDKEITTSFLYDFYREHSYARINEPSENFKNKMFEASTENCTYPVNDLQQKTYEETALEDLNGLKHNNENQINNTIIAIKKCKKPQESLLKKGYKSTVLSLQPNNKQLIVLHTILPKNENVPQLSNIMKFNYIDYKKYEVQLPKNRFKNANKALPYLFKKMPIITGLASNLDYKCTYPYVARSLQEYSNWNIGRRLSSEWFQAKMIQKVIVDAGLRGCEKLTPKFLIMYGRSHGYTPLANYEIFKNKVQNSIDLEMEGDLDTEVNNKAFTFEDTDEIVDVINCVSDINKSSISSHKIKLVDQKVELACSYVKQVALDAGVILKPQEIIPNVIFNGAERMLLKASLTLVEDIIRTARANLVYKGNFSEATSVVGVEDIFNAISQRSQFKFLLKLKPYKE